MEKRKLVKRYIYEGLGFPVLLSNAPLIELRGIWTPDIDYNILQKSVLLGLAHHPSALTGNHVRFIRLWLGLTLSKFGELFGLSHAAVLKWEKSKDKCAHISISTEREIRLLILDKILQKSEDFRNAFRHICTLGFKTSDKPLQVNTQTDLAAI